MGDLEKLSIAWHSLLTYGRVSLSLEGATMIFRHANYGICTSREPLPPDPRQRDLDLKGGSSRPRVVTITVS